jgi:hypothetical protein
MKKAMPLILAFWIGYNTHSILSFTKVAIAQLTNDQWIAAEPPLRCRTTSESMQLVQDRVEAGVMVINALDSDGSRIPFMENLLQDTGYFHGVPIASIKETEFSVHVRAWRRVSREGHDRFVILVNDNVDLARQLSHGNEFVTRLAQHVTRELRPDDDFAWLGMQTTASSECTSSGHDIWKCSTLGLHAYMVTPRGAQTLLAGLNATNDAASASSSPAQRTRWIHATLGSAPLLGWNLTQQHNVTRMTQRGLFHATPKIIVAHRPRTDLLGSFVTPTLLLLAVARFHGWQLDILPFQGSDQEAMSDHFALGDKIDKAWGSGFQDASNRIGYSPMALNAESYDTLGFFPPVSKARSTSKWTFLETLPAPGEALNAACHEHLARRPACYILLSDNPYEIEQHMEQQGGYDRFLSKKFREHCRRLFLKKNAHRLRHYNQTTGYNVAVHVRRGDILDPDRWIDQSVFAALLRHICRAHPEASVHIFSAGKNRDGNWTTLEALASSDAKGSRCASVSIHLDELEFDTWAHMVAANVLIMSKSNFGLIPSLLSAGDVYFPHDYWHLRLSSFRIFDSATGKVLA